MLGVKPRANGRYIVGQHLPKFWMLHVACCWELLRKVWKQSNFWANNFQHCWANDVRSKAPCKRTLHVGQHLPKFWMLHVACCWELLRKVWKRSNFWANNSQHCWANDVRSKAPCKRTLYCCPTSPKILNATCSVLLGVVKKGLKAVKLLSQPLQRFLFCKYM